MKLALVTGSSGFVGRHMVAALKQRRYEVWGSDLVEGADSHDVFRKETDRHCYDLVVHCAYHVGGRAGIDGNRGALAKNVALDAAMFDWAVRTGQPRVLYFSSSAVYPWLIQDAEKRRLVEDDVDLDEIETPDADYGLAKLLGERLARNARALGVNVHVVRPFSGYGEDQSTDYPFPAIVRRAREGDLSVWGPQGQTRDWIHIDDVVRGALAIVEHDVQEPINLCTGIGTEMGDLARMINDEVRGSVYHPGHMSLPPKPDVTYLPDKPTGVHYRVGAPQRMLSYYEPKVTLEEGIRRALAL